MEVKDGEIDYSKHSLSELRDVEAHIDAEKNPKNCAILQRAIASLPEPEETPTEPKSIYASFWQRLGAYILDALILLPLVAFGFWGSEQSRLFHGYYFLPSIVFGLWYHAHLVRRYGGTPGKLLVGIRIVKTDGTPVGYREALLRYSVLLVLATVSQAVYAQIPLAMTDAEYFAMDWQERAVRMRELAPGWLAWVTLATNIWVWSEFIVMLTNKKRRAIHDFIAGTVVVRSDSA